MLIAAVVAIILGVFVVSFIVIKFMIVIGLMVIGGLYFLVFFSLDYIFGGDNIALTVLGTLIIGTAIVLVVVGLASKDEEKKKASAAGKDRVLSNDLDKGWGSSSSKANPKAPCPCGSGKRFENCHGLFR